MQRIGASFAGDARAIAPTDATPTTAYATTTTASTAVAVRAAAEPAPTYASTATAITTGGGTATALPSPARATPASPDGPAVGGGVAPGPRQFEHAANVAGASFAGALADLEGASTTTTVRARPPAHSAVQSQGAGTAPGSATDTYARPTTTRLGAQVAGSLTTAHARPATATPGAGIASTLADAYATPSVALRWRWVVDIRPPGVTDPGASTRIPATAIMGVKISPEHSAAWDCDIEIAPVIDPAEFRGGEFDVRGPGGGVVFRARAESIERATDDSLQITGRGREDLALLGDEIHVQREDALAHNVIADVFVDAGFDATVHDPPPQPIGDEIVQQAQAPADFRDVYDFFERDSSGRFTSTDEYEEPFDSEYPTRIAETSPLKLTSEGLTTTPINIVKEGENFEDGNATVADDGWGWDSNIIGRDNQCASGGQQIDFTGIGDWATWTFQFDHIVPKDALQVGVRYRHPDPVSDVSMTALLTEGSASGRATHQAEWSAETAFEGTANDWFTWGFFPTFSVEASGEYVLTITDFPFGSNEPDIAIDCVAIFDNRFAAPEGVGLVPEVAQRYIQFPRALDAEDQLGEPGTHPPSFWLRSETPTAGVKVDSATLDVDLARDQFEPVAGDLEVRTPATGQSVSGQTSGASGSLSLDLAPDTTTPRVQHAVQLISGDSGTGSPSKNDQPQTLESVSATIDGEAVPVVEEMDQQGTHFDVLQWLGERSGYVWSVDHNSPTGDLTAEAFRRGDPDLRQELPPEVDILDDSASQSLDGYANRVTVRGADREFREGRYEATAEDAEEIDEVGLFEVEIEDRSLNTHNDCNNRARVELQDRLGEDASTATIESTPVIVEPGYPYRVPVLDDGTDPNGGYRTLESTGLAKHSASTLDFERTGGVGGLDDAAVLALLGVGDR